MQSLKNKTEQENLSGIIVVNKPQNFTSHDIVAIMRRLVGIKRIGHTGTLDPMATGVLPVCIGSSTRIMEYLDLDYKTYKTTLKLGITTDTEDIWGETIRSNDISNITREDIKDAILSFIGEIEQVPPKYSALKVNGKKLYEYARAGQEVEIKSRKITIKDIIIENIEDDEATFTVTCSKGTYIRTLCSDIGEKLGSGGVMSALQRIKSGIFTIDEAITVDELRSMSREEILKRLIMPEKALVYFGTINLDRKLAKDFVNGKKLKTENLVITEKSRHKDMFNIYYKDEFLGVGQIIDGLLKAHKVFNVRMQNEDI